MPESSTEYRYEGVSARDADADGAVRGELCCGHASHQEMIS